MSSHCPNSQTTIRIEPLDARATTTTKRERERQTWHRVAREILGDESAQFTYNEVGAPQIAGSDLFISVSHSSSLVAVIISAERCAIDIESLDRNFATVAPRYVGAAEQKFCTTAHSLAKIWSIKEAIYKYCGVEGLSLLSIEIEELTESDFKANIATTQQRVKGKIALLDNHVLVTIY